MKYDRLFKNAEHRFHQKVFYKFGGGLVISVS